jgi:anti-sigma regulatory factor (Ser/Thr protein kinase)
MAVLSAVGIANPASYAHRRYRISRQAVSRQLRRLVREGALIPSGRTRARQYVVKVIDHSKWTYAVNPAVEEHALWEQWIAPRMIDCASNVRSICHYGFTEMVNNVVDHSESTTLSVEYTRSPMTIRILVTDLGVGIFNKLQRDLGFERKQDAVFELCKGKLTTDTAKHTGEGIFFTSRMFDAFALVSDDQALVRQWGGRDWFLEASPEATKGTSVAMTLSTRTDREMSRVFDHYAGSTEDYGFAKTQVLVNLARSGSEQLVSRSQARRILARYEQFKELMLDFTDVDMIGPAFADEIFRVFTAENPQVNVRWMSANAAVERMIRKAQAHEDPNQSKLPIE